MKKLILIFSLIFTNTLFANGLKVIPNGSITSQKASNEYFTGDVRVDMRVGKRDDISKTTFAIVTFEPSARTNWHTHPAGQMLIITFGVGYVQEWGKSKELVKQGDMVWIPKDVKHWHGATSNSAMSHIAVSEMVDEKTSFWLEKVSDEEFNSK